MVHVHLTCRMTLCDGQTFGLKEDLSCENIVTLNFLFMNMLQTVVNKEN